MYLDQLMFLLLSTRGPVNEDVFMAPASAMREVKTMDSDIQEITEQIHRLLLQVRNDSKCNENKFRTYDIDYRAEGLEQLQPSKLQKSTW